MDETKSKGIQMPVSKMHYSMLTQLCRNPLIFKLKYILGVYDGKVGVSGMVGKACHKALEVYVGANPDVATSADPAIARGEALDYGMEYLNGYSDIYINYGKTGSRENMLKTYAQAMKFYFAEEPEYNELLAVEEKLEAEIETVDGDTLPLPAVGVPDLVHKRKDGGIEIIDYKFTKSFTKLENEDGDPHEDYVKIIQAMFLWHLVRKVKGITADRVIFREVKTTENKDKTPQIRDYAVPCNHEPYRIIFYNLYKDAIKFLSNPESIYLPNLSDPFDGEQAGMLYAQGLLNSDMSDVEVMHKVKDVAFVSKKFVASRLERVENQYLPPEERIKMTLAEFGIPVEPVETQVGASVTLFKFKVSAGVRMTTFEKHKKDIARAIEAKGDIRILAPIPGTAFVGVEIPSENREKVTLESSYLVPGKLSIPVGMTVHGEVVKEELDQMPHLLIAGSAGSGKSILLHSIITALTKQMKPADMQLVLIDPKRVELVAFADVKHLKGGKILYEYAEVVMMLKGLTTEMERRYRLLEEAKKRDIKEYNFTNVSKAIPYIVVVIDEFADLIYQGKQIEKKKKSSKSLDNIATRIQVEQMARRFAKMGMKFNAPEPDEEIPSAEDMIVRIAAMGRAAGIHLIIATQRPSVDVITGLIKANFPTRIALTTASATDSKVILGEDGAEKLSGKGDMLFMHPGRGGKERLQGFMIK